MGKKRKIDVKAFRKRLHGLREDVQALSQVTEGERQPVELDQTTVGRLSRMDALQNQAMQLEAQRRRTVEIKRIDAALQRIDEGEFGYCVSCGSEIEPKRLDNDPTTPTCFDCAEMSAVKPGH
jgi:DnaK suppressor protein